ncbi:MAG: glycosyltransferase family 2 protein [Myxococcota bacterium]
MVSVVIPAYNEGQTIERCLRAMLRGAEPGELEIVVVANGCHDDTADRARKFEADGVTVIETPVGSKVGALNLGDDAAKTFPRFYIDADIDVTVEAIREVAELLRRDEFVLAAPRPVVDYKARSRLIRSFYTVWTSLPFFTEGLIGAGIYAFSEQGRARFDRFPDIIADDEFARLQAAPHERGNARRGTFTITPPTTLRGLLKIFTRARAGMYQLHQTFPELVDNDNTSSGRTLEIIARSPRLWPHAPVYLGLMFAAKLGAHRKLQRNEAHKWDRDDTARAEFGRAE